VSRLVTLGHDSSVVEDEIPCFVVVDDASKESVPTPGPRLVEAVLEPITLHELIDAQSQDPLCLSKLSELNGATMKRHFAVNDKGLLIRLSPLDDAEQVVIPRCLANRVMCLAHLPRLAAHPGGARMYAPLVILLAYYSQRYLSVCRELSVVRQESSEKESPDKLS
jgi:hypothetical protein